MTPWSNRKLTFRLAVAGMLGYFAVAVLVLVAVALVVAR